MELQGGTLPISGPAPGCGQVNLGAAVNSQVKAKTAVSGRVRERTGRSGPVARMGHQGTGAEPEGESARARVPARNTRVKGGEWPRGSVRGKNSQVNGKTNQNRRSPVDTVRCRGKLSMVEMCFARYWFDPPWPNPRRREPRQEGCVGRPCPANRRGGQANQPGMRLDRPYDKRPPAPGMQEQGAYRAGSNHSPPSTRSPAAPADGPACSYERTGGE